MKEQIYLEVRTSPLASRSSDGGLSMSREKHWAGILFSVVPTKLEFDRICPSNRLMPFTAVL